jgi:hypothetical protein
MQVYFFALLFAVIIHECGHGLMAKHYGLLGKRLSIFPFGGVIEIECSFLPRRDRALILLSGPAINFAACLVFAVLIWLFPTLFICFEYLSVANFLVGAINLLPIPTFDGFKILFPNFRFRHKTFVSKFRVKTGKVVEIMLNGNETLFEVYKYVDPVCPTKFIFDGGSFYEQELEEWLLSKNMMTKICEMI